MGRASNVSVTGTLDLNTFSETINGLSGAGTVDTVAGGTPIFTVGNNDATSSFSGVMKNTAGTLALTKTGSGTLTLSGTTANTYSGLTTVSSGELDLGKRLTSMPLAAGGLTINAGTVKYTGTSTDEIANTAAVNVSGGTLDHCWQQRYCRRCHINQRQYQWNDRNTHRFFLRSAVWFDQREIGRHGCV